MNTILFPKVHFNHIYEITPEYLKYKGVSCVLLDIDNTLVPYSVKVPDEKVLNWLKQLKAAGLRIAILSNAKRERAEIFSKGIPQKLAEEIGLITIGKAGKPLGRGFRKAEKLLGIPRKEMCIIGDQIFTDILGGNANGVFTILVTPIDLRESRLIRSKRLLERPVLACNARKWKNKGGTVLGRLGVLGWPIGHSISPQLHNTICEVTGYNFYYDKFAVSPEQLESRFSEFQKEGFRGLNLTIPYKEKILSCLDEVDALATEIGAVNTVVFEQGRAFGYNTDIEGFIQSVEEETSFLIQHSKVLILGAGGAARGVAVGCKVKGAAQIDFCNRTAERAQELARQFDGGVLYAQDAQFSQQFRSYDLIVNTTSAGMPPQEDQLPISGNVSFRKGQVCFDAIYTPARTLLLRKAQKEGATVVNGAGMLFWQGIKAFDKWAVSAGCPPLTMEQIKEVRTRLEEGGVMQW